MVLNKPYHSSMDKEIKKAANIVNAFFDSTVDADSSIPVELIRNCAGLAFLTVVKAGFIWSGKLGTGLVIARLEDGSWSPPSGIGTAGVGFGAEIGGEIIDFMIVLGRPSAVQTFKKGTQVSIGAGLDVAVGPVGRSAGANINAGGSGISSNYTYSHAKGMFAGVGLHGSTIMVRGDMNSKFYGREVTPMEILSGYVEAPTGSCDVLYDAIQRAMSSGTTSGLYQPRLSHGSSGSGSSRHMSPQTSNRNSVVRTNSFDRSSSIGPPTTAEPIENDPRLRRYSQYKSERELYAQFSSQKSSGALTGAVAGATTAAYGYAQQQPQYQNQQHYQASPPAYHQPQQAAQPPAQPVKVTYIPASAYAPVKSSSSSSSSRASTPLPPIPAPAAGAETKEVFLTLCMIATLLS